MAPPHAPTRGERRRRRAGGWADGRVGARGGGGAHGRLRCTLRVLCRRTRGTWSPSVHHPGALRAHMGGYGEKWGGDGGGGLGGSRGGYGGN